LFDPLCTPIFRFAEQIVGAGNAVGKSLLRRRVACRVAP
jgi:hypothetical protein